MTEFTDEQRSDSNTAINAKLWATCQAEAKRKFKIHPSAYSNGYASKIYGERGGKWRSDSLKTWFAEDWKAINSSGKIVGGCGDGETKGKVKCLPASKSRSLSKGDRSTLAKRKQKQDPNPSREGAPVMVSSKRRDAMTPEVFAQAILSIEKNYGLRLDARSVWLRMDEFKKVKELAGGKCTESRGWYGLKGACKRGRTYESESKRIASKREISRKIRDRKGLGRGRSRPSAFQYKKVKELGSGAYGVAVLTDRGTVVKTSTGFGSMVGAARSEFEGLMQLEKLGIGPKAIALHGATIEMGLIKGKTIDAISSEGASTVVHQANQMKAANALLELHKSGWTHGDAHLQNILIDEDGAAKIIDAGRATKIGRSNFSTGYHDMMGALKDHPALESLTEALKDPLESFKKETLEAFNTRDRNQVTPGGTVALRKLHKSYLGVAEQFIK